MQPGLLDGPLDRVCLGPIRHFLALQQTFQNRVRNGCRTLPELERGLTAYFRFYNQEGLHQSLGYRTPAEVHADRRRRAGEE